MICISQCWLYIIIVVNNDDRDVYISGGARLYEETLEIVDKMYVERMTAYVKKVNSMVEKKKQNKK